MKERSLKIKQILIKMTKINFKKQIKLYQKMINNIKIYLKKVKKCMTNNNKNKTNNFNSNNKHNIKKFPLISSNSNLKVKQIIN